MVSCGGQATIPMVGGRESRIQVHYAEIVSSIASKSAGPGYASQYRRVYTNHRQRNREGGGSHTGKAIIILNPAEPPLIMRNTVFCLTDEADRDAVTASVKRMVEDVRSYVPVIV